MKDKLKIILIVIILGLGIFTIIYKTDISSLLDKEDDEELETTDSVKFKEEYESLNGLTTSSGNTYLDVEIDSSNVVKYSSYDEIISVIEDGTGVIYLGYPECPWCRNAVSVLLNAASDAGLNTIYYLNMHDERDTYEVEDGELVKTTDGSEGYYRLLEALDEVLDEYYVSDSDGNEVDTGEKRIYVPLVIFVVDGEIVGTHLSTVDSQTDPYVGLTEDEEEELYEIYSSYIHEVLDDICDEKC